jgi:hypothetical protein
MIAKVEKQKTKLIQLYNWRENEKEAFAVGGREFK